jgi:hypothetical protein
MPHSLRFLLLVEALESISEVFKLAALGFDSRQEQVIFPPFFLSIVCGTSMKVVGQFLISKDIHVRDLLFGSRHLNILLHVQIKAEYFPFQYCVLST